MFALLLTAALCVSTGRDLQTELKKENLRLQRTNKVLRQALSSIQTESTVGGSECNSPPVSKCELCHDWFFCEGKTYFITSYAVVEGATPHPLFGCTYPETYTYVDSCPKAEQKVGQYGLPPDCSNRDFDSSCVGCRGEEQTCCTDSNCGLHQKCEMNYIFDWKCTPVGHTETRVGTSIEQRVKEVIGEEFGLDADEFWNDDYIFEDLGGGVDSALESINEIWQVLEEEFNDGFKFDDEEEVETVLDMILVVENSTGDKSAVAVKVSEEASVGDDCPGPDQCSESMIGDGYCDDWCLGCENFFTDGVFDGSDCPEYSERD